MTTDVKIQHDEEDEIRNLLLWHSVTKVSEDTLTLDDGRTLKIQPNWGCGGCSSGNYDLDELNGSPNAITAVEFVTESIDDNVYADGYVYQIFVYAEDQRIKLLEVSGDDGGGWNYGTGYWITVST